MRRRLDSRKAFRRSLIATAVASALAVSNVSWAQSADATLTGRVAPNSEVTARNVTTGATRRTKASADGTYTMVGLPPGTYRVGAGPGTEVAVTLSVASTATLDLATGAAPIAAGTVAEVVVSAKRLVEVRTSEVSNTVSLYDIATVPQITRNFLEFADLVPGMSFNVDSTGNTYLRGGAQLATSGNVYIDGVSQKEYIDTGSGTTGQAGANGSGDPGNPFPQLAVDQYKVLTSNYKAEFGEAASSIVVAKTKSGTNEFHGEAFGTFTNQNLRAETPGEIAAATPNNPKTSSPSEEYGFAVGGPIVRDALHFFATWEHKSLSLQQVVTPAGNASPAALQLLPPSVLSQFGPVNNPFKEDLGFGKIDYEPTSADRFELSGKLRQEKQRTGAGGQTAVSATAQYKNSDVRWNLFWQHSADRWVNEARLTSQHTNSATDSTSPSPQSTYYQFLDPVNNPFSTAGLISVGGPGFGLKRNSQAGFGLQDDFTLPNLQWRGDHTVKFGGRYQAIDLSTQNASADLNNASYFYGIAPVGGALVLSPSPFVIYFPKLNAGIGAPRVTSKDKQFGVYFQDDWVVNQHLVLNLGLRWDYETVPGYSDYRTPANVVAALNGPWPLGPGGVVLTNLTYAQVLALGGPGYPGININNYISTGSNRKSPTDQFQPRFGFSYDIQGDQNHVIFGGFGRSYDRNLFGTLALETTKVALSSVQAFFPYIADQSGGPPNGPCKTAADVIPGSHCFTWDPAFLNPATLAGFPIDARQGEVDLLNNRLKTPYSDQYSIGFRTRLGEWNTTTALSYIKSYNTILGHLGSRHVNGRYYDSTGAPWGEGLQGVPGIGGLVLWDNGGKDKNLQLAIAASKPYTAESGWSMTIAYTYSNAFQTNSSGNKADYNVSYNQYVFDLPFPSLYPYVPSNAIPKHRLVVAYSHDAPWGLVWAAKLTLETPIPLGGAYGCKVGDKLVDVPSAPPRICNPWGGSTLETSAVPRDLFGFRDLDLQVTKNFELPHDTSAYLRFDMLNVLNIHNFDSAQAIWDAGNTPRTPPRYDTAGAILGVPFTLKLTGGFKW